MSTKQYGEVPIFDCLTGQKTPYEGFGPILPYSAANDRFTRVLVEARKRLHEQFATVMSDSAEDVKVIQTAIIGFWSEGWDPSSGNVNLFTTDFGSILADLLRKALGGQLLFRSETDLSHVSCWWGRKRATVEAFPFHKIYKCLSSKDEASLEVFYDGVKSLVLSP